MLAMVLFAQLAHLGPRADMFLGYMLYKAAYFLNYIWHIPTVFVLVQLLLLLLLPFHGLFSRTTWVSRQQNGKPFWILMMQEMMRWQWNQLDHMHIICTSLQTDNHTSTTSLKFFTGWILFLTPNQQCQSTEVSVLVQVRNYCSKRQQAMIMRFSWCHHTPSSLALLKFRTVYFSGANLPRLSRKKGL